MINKNIDKWIRLTDKIVEQFILDYFEDDIPYWDWVTKGGVFNYSDYWFDFSTILECYRLEITQEQLFDWYDRTLLQEINLTLEEFIKSPEKRKDEEKEYLERLRQRVISAEEEFKKAMEQYER